jgi:hypothetical protein
MSRTGRHTRRVSFAVACPCLPEAAERGASGRLVAGFQLDRSYSLAQYDAEADAVGLEPVERYATWERDPFRQDSGYAVSVHAWRQGIRCA